MTFRLAGCVLGAVLQTGAVWAEPPFPLLYNVTGVAADDVLNLRAEPSSNAAIVGQLAYDATEVEAVAESSAGRWLQVGFGEISGWASARYLAERDEGGWPDKSFRCFGTEPFWSLTNSGDGPARLSGPVFKNDLMSQARISTSRNRTDRFMLILEDGPTAVLSQTLCSDGMSDRVYGIEVNLITDDTLLTGCCTLAPLR